MTPTAQQTYVLETAGATFYTETVHGKNIGGKVKSGEMVVIHEKGNRSKKILEVVDPNLDRAFANAVSQLAESKSIGSGPVTREAALQAKIDEQGAQIALLSDQLKTVLAAIAPKDAEKPEKPLTAAAKQAGKDAEKPEKPLTAAAKQAGKDAEKPDDSRDAE